ncbi:MAG TPA: hypothetical protein VGG72_29205 [Bryobacteraceae bacterium]
MPHKKQKQRVWPSFGKSIIKALNLGYAFNEDDDGEYGMDAALTPAETKKLWDAEIEYYPDAVALIDDPIARLACAACRGAASDSLLGDTEFGRSRREGTRCCGLAFLQIYHVAFVRAFRALHKVREFLSCEAQAARSQILHRQMRQENYRQTTNAQTAGNRLQGKAPKLQEGIGRNPCPSPK